MRVELTRRRPAAGQKTPEGGSCYDDVELYTLSTAEQLSDMLNRETDLANEARCILRMAKNFDNDPDVLFPVVYPEWSSPTVMTLSTPASPKTRRVPPVLATEESRRRGSSCSVRPGASSMIFLC